MKNRKYFFVLLLTTAFLFIGSACKDVCLGEKKKHYISDEALKVFNIYKKGNWWVYANNEGTLRDSLSIIDEDSNFDKERCDSYEHLYKTLEILGNNFSIQKFNLECWIDENKISLLLPCIQLEYSLDNNELILNEENVLDSIIINKKTYYNVIKSCSYRDNVEWCCLYSLEYGQLYKVTQNFDTLFLVSYNIQ